jgi:hypothetical protein
MKKLVVITLLALVACAIPKYAYTQVVDIPATVDASIAGRVLCAPTTRSRGSAATATKVGSAIVTAKHVVAACGGNLDYAWSSDDGDDIAIIQYGDPGECIDAYPGEHLVFLGYPGTDVYGLSIKEDEDLILESDVGITENSNISVSATSSTFPYVNYIKGLTVAQATRVRPGYSGGPVMSAEDGRIVGIANAADRDGSAMYFTPISTVCKMIRKEAPYE